MAWLCKAKSTSLSLFLIKFQVVTVGSLIIRESWACFITNVMAVQFHKAFVMVWLNYFVNKVRSMNCRLGSIKLELVYNGMQLGLTWRKR